MNTSHANWTKPDDGNRRAPPRSPFADVCLGGAALPVCGEDVGSRPRRTDHDRQPAAVRYGRPLTVKESISLFGGSLAVQTHLGSAYA